MSFMLNCKYKHIRFLLHFLLLLLNLEHFCYFVQFNIRWDSKQSNMN